MFLCAAEWLTLCLIMPFLTYCIWRYMTRPVVGSPGLYDRNTIMNANFLAYWQNEESCKLAFYCLVFFSCYCCLFDLFCFFLPIGYNLCFGELLEQQRRISPVMCTKNTTSAGILYSKGARVTYGNWLFTLKDDFFFHFFIFIFCLWKDGFHMFYLDKEFKWNYI